MSSILSLPWTPGYPEYCTWASALLNGPNAIHPASGLHTPSQGKDSLPVLHAPKKSACCPLGLTGSEECHQTGPEGMRLPGTQGTQQEPPVTQHGKLAILPLQA